LQHWKKINLDPVFDYSQADGKARKIIAQTFNNENKGKELSVVLSNIKQSAELIYEKGSKNIVMIQRPALFFYLVLF